MIFNCGICDKRLLSHNLKLACSICCTQFHISCISISKPEYSKLTKIFKECWFCINCVQSSFPFMHIIPEEEFKLSLSRFFYDFDVPDLCLLDDKILNPFELNDADKLPPVFDIDPDLNYFNELNYSLVANSNYYFEDSFNEMITKRAVTQNTISFFHHNCRGLKANSGQLFTLLSDLLDLKFTFIGLSETHLNDITNDLYTLQGYTAINYIRSHKSCGGVSLLIKDNVSFIEREDLKIMNADIEALFVEIDKAVMNTAKNVIIAVIYRPPDRPIKEFIEQLTPILNKINKEGKFCYLLGDFNVNLFNINTHEGTSTFSEFLFSFSYIPIINRPTRVTTNSATLIDNIFTNNIDACLKSTQGVLINHISDHFPIFSILNNCTTTKDIELVYKRKINPRSREKFQTSLSAVDWTFVLENNDPQKAYTLFLAKYHNIYDKCFPLSVCKSTYKNKKPWLSEGLMKSIKNKNKLYLKCLREPDNQDLHQKYRLFKNKIASLLIVQEKNHYEELFQLYKNNSRKSWGLIKTIINRKGTSKVKSNSFNHNGRDISNPTEISNKFNDFFINVGPTLAKSISPVDVNHMSFLKQSYPDSLFLSPATTEEIKEIISKLKDASPGYDSILPNILKSYDEQILIPLLHVFNLSLEKGIVPCELKIASVVPIYKNDNPKIFSNYRPISVLPVFSKILEKLMYTRLFKYLNKKNIISKLQFGFQAQHTTFDALINFVDYITTAIENGDHVVGLFLDFSKAFDTVDHSILLDKLFHYGVRGIALDWFQNYLTDRKQFTNFSNAKSEYKNIVCGVPQGSILGPLLFLIYINDLSTVSDALFTILFADDTSIFVRGKDFDNLINLLNNELSLITTWLSANKLSLNIKKTHYMVFTRKNIHSTDHKILLNNHEISRVKETKFLGLLVDEKLTWKNHIDYISKKISKGIGILTKARPFINIITCKTLYYSFIYPYLLYCNHIWGCASKTALQRLVILQKKVIRIICYAPYLSHTAPLFAKLSLLRVQDIYIYLISVFMWKIVNGNALPIYKGMFSYNFEVSTRVTRNSLNFYVPLAKSELGKRNVRYKGCVVWNSISKFIDKPMSQYSFKTFVKTYLIKNPLTF